MYKGTTYKAEGKCKEPTEAVQYSGDRNNGALTLPLSKGMGAITYQNPDRHSHTERATLRNPGTFHRLTQSVHVIPAN